jgi:4-amino-4-deoxy-L-arabinose transferase-like glycosyltransferase
VVPGRLAFWRSPAGEARWIRPTLLVVAGLAALSYGWGADHGAVETLYGAAARSMSQSWRNFFFGALDPAGTVTVDKLPGSMWIDSISLRLFGFHVWALILPHVVEGVLTVLVLFRAVRRLAGPNAGVLAALALAASPVTIALSRGNVPDSLLILLLVLAADATAKAVVTGDRRSLLVAGLWVGLAFQAKMLEAWLVLPAFFVTYLVAAPGPRRRRWLHVALATAVTVVVSLSWVLAVTAVPAHDRPFVDGSTNSSELSQVFVYNGLDRFDLGRLPTPGVVPEGPFGATGANRATAHISPSWHRLLAGPLGRDIGWLLPAALLTAVGLAVVRRKAPRTDPYRAAVIMWGSWVALLLGAFSAGRWVNSYYTAALAPGVAALFGMGAAYLWAHRSARLAPRAVLAAVVTGSLLYGLAVLGRGAGIPGWVTGVAVALVVLVDLLVLVPWGGLGPARRPVSAGMVVGLVALLFIPSVASASMVARGLGPFDTPFEPASVAQFTEYAPQRFATRLEQASAAIPASLPRSTILFATDTSGLAADYILYTGREVLPIGGYSGAADEPTLDQLEALVRTHRLDDVVVPVVPPSTDPRVLWVLTHCSPVARMSAPSSSGGRRSASVLWTYACAPGGTGRSGGAG